MKALLSIGTLLVLLLGIVPSHAVHAWLSDGPVCRMACVETDDCCCKKRQRGLRSADRGLTPVVAEAPSEPCCPDDCVAPPGCERLPLSRAAIRTEIKQPAPRCSVHAPETFSALRLAALSPTRPRAPPT